MDPVIAIRTQATYLAVVLPPNQRVPLLPVSVTDWYLFPLPDKGNTVAP
jgi:hypothetical protein